MTSPDGTSWTGYASANESSSWYSVAYGNGVYVAAATAGAGARIMNSTNGTSWATSTYSGGAAGNSIAYGNGSFVAVTSGNSFISSATSLTATSTQLTLNIRTPSDSDIASLLVLNGNSGTPAEGTTYATSSSVGGSTAACSYAVASSTWYSCTVSSLTNGTPYYFRVFTQDTSGNWSTGVSLPQYPIYTGTSTLTLGNGSTTLPVTFYPSGTATSSNTFTLQTSTSTANVSSITVSLGTSTYPGISLVEITNDAGNTVYGSVSNPASDTQVISLSGLTASTTLTQYRIRITPKTHANMPAVPGTTYTFTPYVTDWVAGAGIHAGSNATTSSIITIDNQSPANPSGITSSVTTNEQILFQYVNPSDTDATSTVILRSLNTSFDTPVEGTIYTAGNTLTTSVVACVKNSITPGVTDSCAYTTPSRSTKYFFKVFSQDKAGNFSTGQTVTASGIVIPSPAGGGFIESYSGTTTITGGGTGRSGGGSGGTGTTTNATTTTSTSTPGQGGGGGDVGMINYNGSTYAVTDVPFYESIFNFFTSALTSSAPQAYAETSSTETGCLVSLFGICLLNGR
jgi:hypothetical protein